LRNFELLIQAGATLLPANPSYYTRPQTVQDVVDTVVARVLDHLQVSHRLIARWQEEPE
jgi:4-hydroxy-3-polyprenylbenzoate decarboxylase